MTPEAQWFLIVVGLLVGAFIVAGLVVVIGAGLIDRDAERKMRAYEELDARRLN